MADDKYAPTSHDGTKQVHEKHRQLIKDVQEANKKARADAVKPKAQHADKPAEGTEQTQPPTSPVPTNPEAPANQPTDGTSA